MKKKGFTLVELLGVIVIISLLLVIAFPQIISRIKSTKSKNDKLTEELIYNAASLFTKNHSDIFAKRSGRIYCIKLDDLVGEGYLNTPITISSVDGDITNVMVVKASYSNYSGFTFTLVDKKSCQDK